MKMVWKNTSLKMMKWAKKVLKKILDWKVEKRFKKIATNNKMRAIGYLRGKKTVSAGSPECQKKA